ncbi:unnamed protein product [Adineta ricciae]|uniref:FAD-binding PCMH-type domain-containing protein n=1 Tax=Adineta ricciae TaxID=249248 RepID=A0A814DL61_ADIRI|nr:unnamed protein product [Adineta ricciae]CAF1111459.1 unnamed protein product [Adineta ricciae]
MQEILVNRCEVLEEKNCTEKRRCRCLSYDKSCWPNSSAWQTFNESVNGQLVSVRPSAAPCNSNPLNVEACTTARQQWRNAVWRSDQPGAMQNHNWENSSCSVFYNSTSCHQGSVPILAVNATLPEHVEATIRFVEKYNLRLVVKATGHDFFGRSTAVGSLLLWLHHMKNRTLIPKWSSCRGETFENVIRVDAGVQWGEVYRWLATYNLIAIGGASATVGATGGFLQGGGHGPLTPWKGLAVDQVLQFEVVLADGRRQIVNFCENPDLFWALRGGGGGTFAVVLSAILRTYPTPSIVGSYQAVFPPTNSRYADFLHHFVRSLPALSNMGWAGYFYLTAKTFTLAFLSPNGNYSTAYQSMHQLFHNFSDLNFTEPYVFTLPTFLDFFSALMEATNENGDNFIMGSRLLPEAIIRNQPQQVADAFLRIIDSEQDLLVGHFTAGGKVSDTTQNNSVNPLWRTALLHMLSAQFWLDETPIEDQVELAKRVTQNVGILQTVSGGEQSGAYLNEADPNEVNWQQKFFGTREHYNRLKTIKDRVDPNGLFVCNKCVGSDDWTEDLNCPNPKRSIANKHNLFLPLVLIAKFLLSYFKIDA